MIKIDESFNIQYLDASGFNTFKRCPAKYFFSRILGLQPVNYNKIAMDFGSAMHRALPNCYDAENNNKAMSDFKDEWTKLGYDYTNDDEKRNEVRASAMLDNFILQRSGKLCPYKVLEYPINAPTKATVSKYEVPFLIDIGGNLPCAGRIDLPVRWKSTGDLWALDYKTASEISNRYFKSFENAPQSILYTIAMSQIANERARGMIIEAVRVSKVNAETQLSFNYISDAQIESFMRQANQTSKDILECNDKKQWPKNFAGCSSYNQFGVPGSNCPYLPMCIVADWKTLARTFKQLPPFHPFDIDLNES